MNDVEEWEILDMLAMFQQLGVVSLPASAGAWVLSALAILHHHYVSDFTVSREPFSRPALLSDPGVWCNKSANGQAWPTHARNRKR